MDRALGLVAAAARKHPVFHHRRPPPRHHSTTATTTTTTTTTDAAPPDRLSAPPHDRLSAPPHGQPAAPRLAALRSARPPSAFLTDSFARTHTYLRLSLTERCNLRCTYCMPAGGVALSPPAQLLTTPEIALLAALFVGQGVTKIRLTGGEPTVRRDFVPLVAELGRLRADGLRELCVTTNGLALRGKLDALVAAGLTGVNLSLDTLDPDRFRLLTRRRGWEAVMASLERIVEMNGRGAGIRLKVNCVVMRGVNEGEMVRFVELGRARDVEVRFIEYMPFDGNRWARGQMVGYDDMLAIVRAGHPGLERVPDGPNETSKTYRVPGFVGKVGFITSMTDHFCAGCNRLRITSDGSLKVCLFGNSEVSLRDLLREGNGGRPIDEEAWEAMKRLEMDRRGCLPGREGPMGFGERDRALLEVIGRAVGRKKARHAGMGKLENMKNRPMILIGG
jgi:cyclic pyranopterin phosphate synthase